MAQKLDDLEGLWYIQSKKLKKQAKYETSKYKQNFSIWWL